MARVELRIVLSRLVQRFRWTACGAPAELGPLTTLRPRGGVFAQVAAECNA
jgi:cytochrome P450